MLPSVQSFADQLKALPTTVIPLIGAQNFAQDMANFMDQVQATPGGSVGIFTFNQAVLIPLLAALPPVPNSSWVEPFADAWATAVSASVITPGTVTNVVWLGSGSLDTVTSPSAASTITTIAAAKAQLVSELLVLVANNNPPVPMAQAINDATLKFVFLCIGLGPPPSFTPIPIPLDAE